MVSVNLVEFTWILLNTITLVFTITALFDARADRDAVRLLNGKARELAASGIVRREAIRVVVQLLLLGVALPGLFSDREASLSPVVVALMAVPVLLLLASFWDARERKKMTVLVTAEALVVKTTSLDRIEAKVDHGTEVAQQAYDAANHVKERFDAVNLRITAGEELATERHGVTEAAIDTTAAEVHDLHEGTAPTKGIA